MFRWRAFLFGGLFVLSLGRLAIAGVHYSGETYNTLPSQWQGFITDQRSLRNPARKARKDLPATPLRKRYLKSAEQLQALAKKRTLSAKEQADLGALYLRLGEITQAITVLRQAQKAHPKHFEILICAA